MKIRFQAEQEYLDPEGATKWKPVIVEFRHNPALNTLTFLQVVLPTVADAKSGMDDGYDGEGRR